MITFISWKISFFYWINVLRFVVWQIHNCRILGSEPLVEPIQIFKIFKYLLFKSEGNYLDVYLSVNCLWSFFKSKATSLVKIIWICWRSVHKTTPRRAPRKAIFNKMEQLLIILQLQRISYFRESMDSKFWSYYDRILYIVHKINASLFFFFLYLFTLSTFSFGTITSN